MPSEGEMRRNPLVVTYAVLAAVVMAFLAAVGYGVWRQIPHLTEVSYPPVRVMRTGDPKIIEVGADWPHEGYCEGEFSASVTETPTEVIVVNFLDRRYSPGSCGGVGTVGHMAWAEVKLGQALGSRRVIRASDGMSLPVG